MPTAAIALAALLGAACANRTSVEYTSAGPPGWSEEVAGAAGEWNTALEARGCPPAFEASQDGLVVRWVPRVSEDDFGLVYGDGEIRVLDQTKVTGEYRGVLMHALGRTLGLAKQPADSGAVMGENLCALPDHLTPGDIAAAVALLGC